MEQELFDTLAELEMRAAQLIMDPDSAKFLSILAISNKAETIVEVGSGLGYSTLWLAYAASVTGGKVITCEIDPAKAAETQANLAKANLAESVEVLVGDARELLRQRSEPVDLLFIDGDYGQYETYFDVVYKRMNIGSMVVADKVVAHENDLSDYTTYVQNHPNLESVTVPVGQGLEITVKISE
ncbi:MAG: O-methyltransferase [Anaerolineae bacterium]|nr:O-methyltransferase [Anaerolineae bacterium]